MRLAWFQVGFSESGAQDFQSWCQDSKCVVCTGSAGDVRQPATRCEAFGAKPTSMSHRRAASLVRWKATRRATYPRAYATRLAGTSGSGLLFRGSCAGVHHATLETFPHRGVPAGRCRAWPADAGIHRGPGNRCSICGHRHRPADVRCGGTLRPARSRMRRLLAVVDKANLSIYPAAGIIFATAIRVRKSRMVI